MRESITLKQRIIALFLTILFIGYVGNITFFAHEHKVGNVVVVHSHLGSSAHNHSASAIKTIFCISHYDSTLSFIFILSDVIENLLGTIILSDELCDYITVNQYFSLRAPPVL